MWRSEGQQDSQGRLQRDAGRHSLLPPRLLFHSHRETAPLAPFGTELAQDTPWEATEFGKNLWQQGSWPQLHFWLAKFTAGMGRNTVLSKTPQGKPLSDRAQQKRL